MNTISDPHGPIKDGPKAWLRGLGDQAGEPGADVLARHLEVTARSVRRAADEGRFPPGWYDVCEALGRAHGIQVDRAWFFRRRARLIVAPPSTGEAA